MTQYVIESPVGNYLWYIDVFANPRWSTDVNAARFDSMTEAELFAIAHNLGRYKIVPVKIVAEPIFTYDLGGEG